MFRQIIHPTNKNELIIQLPEEYLSKDIEVIAFQIQEGIRENKEETPNSVFRDTESAQEENKDIQKIQEFFRSLPTVDMSDFKFDRDEANER